MSTSEGSFRSGDALSASELRRLNEALMQRLLRLDGIEAVGEAKILRRTQVSCLVLTATTFLMLGSKVVEKELETLQHFHSLLTCYGHQCENGSCGVHTTVNLHLNYHCTQ